MKKATKVKIVLITNYCPFYRRPLFRRLAELYDTEFFFTGRQRIARARGYYIPSYIISHSSTIELIYTLICKKYDVIISSFPSWPSFFAFMISNLRKKPFIIWTEEWYQPKTLSRKIKTPVLKFVVRRITAFVVPGTRSKLHMFSLGASIERIFVSPDVSYVDLDHTDFEKAKKIKWNLGIRDEKVILYLGRLVPYKGADILVKAFARVEREMKDAFLLIAGSFEDENFKNYLVDLCKELKLEKVKIQGYVSPEEKSAYYLLSNIFVLPSIETPIYCEAWGLTLNEAMYVGKPVIATDAVGASCDLIRNGVNGYIVKNANIYELYEAMKRILSDDELERRMEEESRKIITDFNYENMVRGFTEAVNRALALA